MIEEDDYSVSEKEAIEKLREKIPRDQEKELYDDTYRLYLILKDQNFNYVDAENLLSKMLKWRQEVQINKIHEFKLPEVIEKYFENVLIGFAKNGAPVRYLPLGRFDNKGIIMSTKHADIVKMYVKIIENDIELLRKQKKMSGSPKCVWGRGEFSYNSDMPAVMVAFEGESEFPLSLIEELGRSRILKSLYFNGLRLRRTKMGCGLQ
ncbi:hypothetical protein AVEN_68702-1 [Araneus ventricosus]|uniref:CRAL/TRIO N-terminal domain-containing protein n=1 Tax=Araneus ventricosus TaxID=182803 RepID=A0A4Y2KZG0_ARAVE|nr:hypothetical protein AVEN_68702-1 [Araneus ventricosus]